ncbi:MAG TPA: proline dehydrogenase family protein [Actinomycetes bacterium]|nr:proline dehydrogenase family protein [Actinomycetes bacterium]
MIRRALLAASRSETVKRLATTAPGVGDVVTRFAAGETTESAVDVTRQLIDDGLLVSLDHLGEDTLDRVQAEATRDAYLELLGWLGDEGLSDAAEVSVKLSAVGQALRGGGPAFAAENAFLICEAAHAVGTTVTLDMEDHTTTDLTLSTLEDLRGEFPATGAVLQAYLRRTEADCRTLSTSGSRVRLCKGAYKEPESVAFQGRSDVDLSYVRCLRTLMAGDGYPMVATHDSRLISIAEALAVRNNRETSTYEFQMLYGVRRDEQRRLADAGEQVRVYVPYGADWYGYLVRRMAERPANLMLGVRAMLGAG